MEKKAQPQDEGLREIGGGNTTNKQMHIRVPVCPACRYTMGQKKRKETDLFGEKSSFTLGKMGVNQQNEIA